MRIMVLFTLFICKQTLKNESFFMKSLVCIEKVRTFASAFEKQRHSWALEKSSLKDLHNREVVVQEAIEKSIG